MKLFPLIFLASQVIQPANFHVLTTLSTPGANTQVNFVAPTDPNIQYTGRWDHSKPLHPWCAWRGSTLSINFIGVGCGVILDPGISTEWYRILLDGNSIDSRKIALPPGRNRLTLVRDLPYGLHRLDLVKETYFGDKTTFHGFFIHGAGLTTPPPRPPHRIEFYGDSNFAGLSLESERNDWAKDLMGCHFAVPAILSRMLHAEYHNISMSGETLMGMNKRYDRMEWGHETPQWNFQNFTPDVVIVNLGANDVGRPESAIRADYNALLDKLRLVHPNAHIMLSNGVGWSFNETANYTMDVVAARNDPNMSVANFPWVFEQGHGCQTDHAGMATYLARHLESVLGWSVSPPDVQPGFGLDGDVANGSFEGIAPFGGFAWRYMDSQKVKHLEDPLSAQDGSAFLRMNAGGTVHQPNPARNGNWVQVNLWLRGLGSATLTIDFHDQEVYSNPMAGQSTTVILNPQWQHIQLQVQAPAHTPRPVFNYRLTILADALSLVDVDHIQSRILH